MRRCGSTPHWVPVSWKARTKRAYRVGLLINFHVPHLKDGIKRMVNNL